MRLDACKALQLKELCVSLGVNSSGTKPILTKAIDAAFCGPHIQDGAKILSLDMGIRNLGMCTLEYASGSAPRLNAWKVLQVSAPVEKVTGALGVKETFEPVDYAKKAYALVSAALKTDPPDIVLIERQRYRTMGAAAVQEWTVRVNMFENMLHAIFRTYKELGLWKGQINSVNPSRMVQYWQSQWKTEGQGRVPEKESKLARMKFVESMLVNDSRVKVLPSAKEAVASFRKRSPSGQGKKKSDDLADCLLHGLAFVDWNHNRISMAAQFEQERLLAAEAKA